MNTPVDSPSESINVAALLAKSASQRPDAVAIAMPLPKRSAERRQYRTITFAQLEDNTNRLAAGLSRLGIGPGKRIALLVRPGIEFIELTFALFKTGGVTVLIDPGMGRRNLLRCLDDVEPDGFVAIAPVHAMRVLLGSRYSRAKMNVTLGRRWFWGGATYHQLLRASLDSFKPHPTQADDPAAIIFTTGSTGPPKGVLYRHGNFFHQVEQIRDQYRIEPGEIDLPGFPLFGLFNAAMGVTTVVPDMDPTRPAQVDPNLIIEAIEDWKVTQAFGSPAIWNVVGRHCERHHVTLPTLRRVLSAGAPVPPEVLQRMTDAMPDDGEMHTPYGATESLPVATISASEVLGETAARTVEGAGTCVGQRFSGIDWQVVRAVDGPIASVDLLEPLPAGEIGELIVQGPVVTTQYITRTEANVLAKIPDGESFWHRMGDMGYLDSEDRFWFCGRKAHRVMTADGTMYPVCCEAIFNQHDAIYRSALVGIGPAGSQRPVLVAEPHAGAFPKASDERMRLIDELYALGQTNELTQTIERGEIFFHRSLPVDIRHNAKIFREDIALWAAKK